VGSYPAAILEGKINRRNLAVKKKVASMFESPLELPALCVAWDSALFLILQDAFREEPLSSLTENARS
jgi:hypothetical protein